MDFPEKIVVTEQIIDISKLTAEQKTYYKGLADKLVTLYKKFDKDRVVFSISGPPGSGKSVIAAILQEIIEADKHDFHFYTIGLDAFFHTNKYLDEKNLRGVKGRFDTYDVDKLKEKFRSFVSGNRVKFPIYSRRLHEPVDDKIVIDEPRTLLLIEGLWLLRNDGVWASVRENFSYNFFVSGDESDMKANTIKRHIAGGRSPENAQEFFDANDDKNTQEVLKNSIEPDEQIEYFGKVS